MPRNFLDTVNDALLSEHVLDRTAKGMLLDAAELARGERIGKAMLQSDSLTRPEPARVATAIEIERQRYARRLEHHFSEWAKRGDPAGPGPFRYVANKMAEEEVREPEEPERFDTSAE